MKKYYFFYFILAIIFIACSKDSINNQVDKNNNYYMNVSFNNKTVSLKYITTSPYIRDNDTVGVGYIAYIDKRQSLTNYWVALLFTYSDSLDFIEISVPSNDKNPISSTIFQNEKEWFNSLSFFNYDLKNNKDTLSGQMFGQVTGGDSTILLNSIDVKLPYNFNTKKLINWY